METSSEGIKVTFESGEIVDITAEKGDQVMKDLVFKNKGARALGECAPRTRSKSNFPIRHYLL